MYGYYFDAIFNNKHVIKPQRARTTVIAHIMRMRVYKTQARETMQMLVACCCLYSRKNTWNKCTKSFN